LDISLISIINKFDFAAPIAVWSAVPEKTRAVAAASTHA